MNLEPSLWLHCVCMWNKDINADQNSIKDKSD